ncbi:MAG TPA: hypothetical protein VGX48_19685 [Pyrinomonadaceae bacterium]|nr:hypothetical protein [Pyrinomonadaceae bacterium]
MKRKWEHFFGRLFGGAFGGRAPVFPADAAGPRRAGADSFVGRFERAGVRLFKNNCLVLPWVREREEIEASVQGARADLLRSWNVYRDRVGSSRTAAQAESDWRRALGAFRRHTADLNRLIAAYNLKAPSAAFRQRPLDADRELESVTRDA